MKISFVVAVSENGVIGIQNDLPWHLPDDLKFFKKTTLGKPVIMGRKTFLSFGRPLPGRMNIILSRSLEAAPEGALLFSSMENALDYLGKEGISEACIIGGGTVFEKYYSLADELIITKVHTAIEGGETFFRLPDPKIWQRVWFEEHKKDAKHIYDFTFERWERIKK